MPPTAIEPSSATLITASGVVSLVGSLTAVDSLAAATVRSTVNEVLVCAVAALPAASLMATENEWLASESAFRPAEVIDAVQAVVLIAQL